MAYDDKKLSGLFPTRSGTPTGTANERKMLDNIGSADGFATRVRVGPDGLKTYLKTRGGMPHFWNDPNEVEVSGDPSVPIEMDSGAVVIGPTAPLHPDAYKDCILHYGVAERAYVLLKRLLGKIKPPAVTNATPPLEGVPGNSFLAPANRVGVRDDNLVGLLYGKKLCAAYCPPSMFTGKARLYAQALYGAPVKQWVWAVNVGTGDPPELSYKGSDRMKLTTHSGIYLDSQWTHWLLSMDNLGVKITRLKRDEAVKPLVKVLAAGGTEAEKVEAYILSRSYPDESMSFWIAIPGTPTCSMLGYGWKFNWSGTVADIIHHSSVAVSLTLSDIKSTHYRVAFNRNSGMSAPAGMSLIDAEKLRWSAILSIVEGPVQWHNQRYGQVVSSPSWSDYTLGLFGEKFGVPHGNAPVYCFYKRDELEVIRFQYYGGENNVKYKRVSTPLSWIGQHDWSITNMSDAQVYGTIGMDSASGEVKTRTTNPVTTGFSSTAVNGVDTATSYSYTRIDQGAKAFGEPFSVTSYTSITESTLPGRPTESSAVHSVGADGVELIAGFGVDNPDGPTMPSGRLEVSNSLQTTIGGIVNATGSHSEATMPLIVVPFNDAEAVYLRTWRNVARNETGTTGSYVGYTNSWAKRYRHYIVNADGETFSVDGEWLVELSQAGGSFGINTGSTAHALNTTNDVVIASSLISSAGTVDYSPTSSLAVFFSGEIDSIPQQFWTSSSLLGAIYGEGATQSQGFIAFDDPPPFIGWA